MLGLIPSNENKQIKKKKKILSKDEFQMYLNKSGDIPCSCVGRFGMKILH
jgi:hypothetical protein